MKKITLIGSTGLVGQEIKKAAEAYGFSVLETSRDDRNKILSQQHDHIIYCAGENKCSLDFIDNIVDVNAHYLAEIIKRQNFEHLTYFSSTRIYGESPSTSEDDIINFNFNDPRALFNASKILGESICGYSKKPVLILRPSNIYGLTTTSKLFLPAITRDAIQKGVVNMFVTKEYSKDYINVIDVAYYALELAKIKMSGVFNIASGENITAEAISGILERETFCKIIWNSVNNVEHFAPINTDKLKNAFPFYKPRKLEDSLKELISNFKATL